MHERKEKVKNRGEMAPGDNSFPQFPRGYHWQDLLKKLGDVGLAFLLIDDM